MKGSQPVLQQNQCSKHQVMRSKPDSVQQSVTARHHARHWWREWTVNRTWPTVSTNPAVQGSARVSKSLFQPHLLHRWTWFLQRNSLFFLLYFSQLFQAICLYIYSASSFFPSCIYFLILIARETTSTSFAWILYLHGLSKRCWSTSADDMGSKQAMRQQPQRANNPNAHRLMHG